MVFKLDGVSLNDESGLHHRLVIVAVRYLGLRHPESCLNKVMYLETFPNRLMTSNVL